MMKYTGTIKDTVERYIGEGGSSENQYFDDLSTAPGNDVIRIKSFEILPGKPQANIDIESGIKFKLQFMCYKENAMLDVNFKVFTLDDMCVFLTGKLFGEVGEKDSKRGMYTAEFEVPPYTLNTGKYKVLVFFGENQKHVVCTGLWQYFEIDNTMTDMGLNLDLIPGIVRLKNDAIVKYEG
jgi:lipopolysaccharide transport system ATP-binding protein